MAYPEKRDGVPTGKWWGEVDLRKTAGKRFKRCFDNKKTAEGYEVFVRLTGAEPPSVDNETPSGRTFATVAEECKQVGGPRGKWKRGRDKSVLQRLDEVVSLIGHHDIIAVNTSVLDTVVEWGRKRKLSNSTVNRYLAAASAVLHFAFDREYIQRRPKVPLQLEINKQQGVLRSFDQEDAILRAMEDAGHRMEAFCVRVLVETGLRKRELLEELRRDQIEIETLPDQTENGWINFDGDQTKNTEGRRVYIRPALARELRAALAQHALPDAFQLLKRFKSAVRKCGLPENLVIHSLRHTRNTRLRKAGVDMKIRMTMLGHKDIETSMRYDHVDTDDQLAAAKIVEVARGLPVENGGSAQIVPFKKQLGE